MAPKMKADLVLWSFGGCRVPRCAHRRVILILQPDSSGMSQRFQSATRLGMANGGLVLDVLQERLSDTRDVGLVKTPVAEIATAQFWTSGLMRASVL